MRAGAVSGVAIAGLLACSGDAAFLCLDDSDCVGGVCQSTGGCSFPDEECPSGQRYGEHAHPDVAGECVAERGTGSTTDATPATTESPPATTTTDPTTPVADSSTGDPQTTSTSTTTGDPAGSSSSTGEPLDPDLLLWFQFEDLPGVGALDSSVHGFDASCLEGQCPEATPGPFGQAALFDGTDDALDIPDNPILQPTMELTAAVWMRPDVLDGDSRRMPFGKAHGAGVNNSFVLFFFNDIGAMVPGWRVRVGMNSNATDETLGLIVPFRLGQWVHLALTYDGTTMSMYLDGLEVASRPVGTPLYDDHPVTIGYDINNDAPVGNFFGAIDDVRLYGRALDSDEIAALATR